MKLVKLVYFLVIFICTTLPLQAADFVKLSGTRFEMEVPKGWSPGYKDIDEKMLMVYLKDASSGMTLEGVYLRKIQEASYSLADFKKWRIDAESKRYDGKNFMVVKEASLMINGESGNYLITEWKDNGTDFEKHTAQYLKDGKQYMVVMHGPKGKVDVSLFDHAVKSWSIGKE